MMIFAEDQKSIVIATYQIVCRLSSGFGNHSGAAALSTL
jgi:hypothetical protein